MKQRKVGSKVFITLIMFYLLIPLVITVIYSLFEKWTAIIPQKFSLESYKVILTDPEFLQSIVRTLIMCIIPIVLTTILVLLALFVTILYFPRLEKYVQIICMIPYTIQGVILSVSILGLYVSFDGILSNRIVMLLGAYCIIILPYIYQGIRNGMRAINMTMLIEAAQMLGCTKLHAFFKVIVPNLMSAITVSSLLAIGIIFGDYVLVRNLAGTSFENVQIYLYQTMKSDSMKASAVFVVIMFITFLIAAFVLFMKKRSGSEKMKGK